jgi:cytochrome b pre-mRNA-processing protein 3
LRRDRVGSISAPERKAQPRAAVHQTRRFTIRRLFAGLTSRPKRGQALFDAAVAEARRPHWFVEGAVPDTVEGRFAMLATVVALLVVRLEREGATGEAATVALTERFVESMDAEIRQMGVNDPTLGRQVRALVGALAARVERWSATVADDDNWTGAISRSVYRDEVPGGEALVHSEAALRTLWQRLEHVGAEEIAEGRLQ